MKNKVKLLSHDKISALSDLALQKYIAALTAEKERVLALGRPPVSRAGLNSGRGSSADECKTTDQCEGKRKPTLIVRESANSTQVFLTGHVDCLTASR